MRLVAFILFFLLISQLVSKARPVRAIPDNMFHALQILGCRNEQTAASWLEEKQAGFRLTCATEPESDLVGGNRHCPLHPTVFQKTLQLWISPFPLRRTSGLAQQRLQLLGKSGAVAGGAS